MNNIKTKNEKIIEHLELALDNILSASNLAYHELDCLCSLCKYTISALELKDVINELRGR